MAGTLVGRFNSYFEVFFLFAIAGVCLPVTLLKNPLLLLASPSDFRAKWFESLWKIIGRERATTGVQPTIVEELMSRAEGMVLDIGPGTGEQCYHFKADQIEMVYGAEPNHFMHERLLEQAKTAGLGGRYIAMNAGAQPDSLIPALEKQGLIPKGSTTLPEDGVFDSIVSVKVMCSVPREQTAATVAVFQRLLKPKGEFLFFEHVENNTDKITQLIVSCFGWIWPYFTGGCRLDSKLDRAVLSMGGWAERRVQTVEEFQGYEIIRYVKGVCVKA